MTASIIDTTAGAEYSAYPCTVTKPAAVAVGDVIVLHAAAYSTSGGVTTVPGFTQVGIDREAYGNMHCTVWQRTIDGSEGASFTYSRDQPISNGVDVGLVVIRGGTVSGETSWTYGNTTSQTLPEITVASGGLLLGFKGEFSASAPITTPPANWTETLNYGSTEYIYSRSVSAGTIAAEALSSTETVTWTAFVVAIADSGGGAPAAAVITARSARALGVMGLRR